MKYKTFFVNNIEKLHNLAYSIKYGMDHRTISADDTRNKIKMMEDIIIKLEEKIHIENDK